MTLLELTLETAINEAGEFKDVRLSKEDAEYVLSMLKEQEPIAPSVCGSKDDGLGCWWYMCGKCKMPIAPKERFCRRCGQKVKWD